MKLSVPRLFDAARLLSTKAGQELSELINFSQYAFEQLIRALRNGLTFEDNFNAKMVTVTLRHNREQSLNVSGTITGIIPLRVISFAGLDQITKFGWYITSSGSPSIKIDFSSADATRDVTVTLVVLLS